ncbi:MAG: hypothetical protein E6J20_13280 [Chloroflexi bacterium]|nr:MAG: hypothetical protein E6J20_13280 [Chloroflexota bacterium]
MHRLTDGEFIGVQVKSRTDLRHGMVSIVIPSTRLVDDRALIVAGLLTDDGLGSMLLVIDEGTFKKVAARDVAAGEEVYFAEFSVDDFSRSHWRPFLVARKRLAERLMGSPPPAPAIEFPADLSLRPMDRHNQWLGFLGESEVVRRLAENSRLDLFRPFPDLEMVEVLARDNATGGYLGLQVKAAGPVAHGAEVRVAIHKATFIPASNTFVLVLAWIAENQRFADECLVVPTLDLPAIAREDATHWRLNFRPNNPERTPLDPYRHPLSKLSQLAEDLTVL